MSATDDELQDAIDKAATIALGKELDTLQATDPADPAHKRMRAAAIEICRRAGLLQVLRAISADGELRPPPPWPQADIVPVGGGPGYIDVDVRSFMPGKGVRLVGLRCSLPVTQDMIADAYSRGYFKLRKMAD